MPDVSKAVLITGCSTGIGAQPRSRSPRRRLDGLRHRAAAESIADLADKGLQHARPRRDRRGVDGRGGQAPSRTSEGAVGVLINNAGYSQSGAVETVPMDDVRRQFETNVFGLVRMCQLVLPGHARRGVGRIVNISSDGRPPRVPGRRRLPRTKYAVEAISDALRFEVRDFGVAWSLIEPGLITSEFGETAASGVDDTDTGGDYGDFNRRRGEGDRRARTRARPCQARRRPR